MKKEAGFTLIETLIAIFILTMTVGGLLTLAASGYFSVRYARNQIVANNLMQESLEYIRNSRDEAAQSGTDYWSTWKAQFNSCTSASGCIVDPYTNIDNAHIQACPANGCPAITFYPGTGFYGYNTHSYPSIGTSGTPYATSYVRTITARSGSDANQLIVTVKMTWSNGNSQKTSTQSILLTNWNL